MKGRFVIVIAALVLIGFGAYVAFHSREPSYHGKRLNAWLDDLIRLDKASQSGTRPAGLESHQNIENALSQMGTNTVPFIIRRLAAQDDKWRVKYRDWWPEAPQWVKRVLPAPALEFSDFPGSGSASLALLLAGTNAIPMLAAALQYPNPLVRETAAQTLSSHAAKSDPLLSAIPALTAAMTDSNVYVRLFVAGTLGRCGPAASNAIPALTKALHDTDAGSKPGSRAYVRAWSATALGRIGPLSRSALPELRILLQDTDPYLHSEAAVAIWRIDADVDTALPILMQELSKSNENSKWEWIDALGEMGPRATNAVPVLQQEYKSGSAYNRERITRALHRIDPEATVKPVAADPAEVKQ